MESLEAFQSRHYSEGKVFPLISRMNGNDLSPFRVPHKVPESILGSDGVANGAWHLCS